MYAPAKVTCLTAAQRLDLAEWLIESGATRSGLTVLGKVRGSAANRARQVAGAQRLRPLVYALATLDDGALAIPLTPTPGVALGGDEEFQSAHEQALRFAKHWFEAPELPSVRFRFEEWVSGFGGSLGLGAALAVLNHFASSDQRLRVPVLATGVLEPDGSVSHVGHLPEKLAIAFRELAGDDGLVLCPFDRQATPQSRCVASLDEAVALVFGSERLRPDAALTSLETIIRSSELEPDHEVAMQSLLAALALARDPADRARVLLDLGSRARHAGLTEQAISYHEQAIGLLRSERNVVGEEAAERFELERWGTLLDEFCIQAATAELSARLERPFLRLRNEMRARGMLAQALATAGDNRAAVQLRQQNLSLQKREAWLRSVLPGTYCYLTLDSARAGMTEDFEAYASELCQCTPPGNEHQWRYNASVIARGLVLSGRFEQALQWACGARILGLGDAPHAVRRLLAGSERISDHPEVSTARALVRALRHTGQTELATALAARVDAKPGLVGWLAGLVQLEALRGTDAVVRAKATLQARHAAATAYYPALLESEGPRLEQAIDAVWY